MDVIDEADVLACRIGRAIIRYNSVELTRVDPQDSRAMWAKVRQLTGAAAAPTEFSQVIQPSRPIL